MLYVSLTEEVAPVSLVGASMLRHVSHLRGINTQFTPGARITDVERGIREGKYKLGNKIIIWVGTNNIARTTADQIMQDYQQLITTLFNEHPTSTVLLIELISRPIDDEQTGNKVETINRLLHDNSSGWGVTIIQMHKYFIKDGHPILNLYMERNEFTGKTDRLHLSPAGVWVFRSILLQKLTHLWGRGWAKGCNTTISQQIRKPYK